MSLAGSELPLFLLVMLLTALVLGGSHRYLINSVRQLGTDAEIPDSDRALSYVKPAELAYLIRNGDLTHTIIVLSFDILHRAVKQNQDGGVELTNYEKRIWESTRSFLKNYAKGKASDAVGGQLTPMRIVTRLPGLVKTVGSSSREMVARVARDPRNIRRYVSSAGVMRLAADFWSAGYQKMIEEKLHEHLLAEGLLVPAVRRQKYARRLIFAFIAGFLCIAVAAFTLINGFMFALACFLASLLNTAWLSVALGLVELIPIFNEFKEVTAIIQRKSLRLKVVRAVMTWAQGIIWTVIFLPLAILLFIEYGLLNLCFSGIEPALFLVVPAMMVNWFILIKLGTDAFFISVNELPTRRAITLVEARKVDLKSTSPFKSFQSVLSSASYDPEFSEILAIYGIETLWLLA